MLVPAAHAQFGFGSSYGSTASAVSTWGNQYDVGGDGVLSASTSSSGSSSSGGASGAASALAASHEVGAGSSVDCTDQNWCFDNGEGWNGAGGDAEGQIYDTYTASCTSFCTFGSSVQPWLEWTITGSFDGLWNGTCAEAGCNTGYTAIGYQSLIRPIVYLVSGTEANQVCSFESSASSANGCPQQIVDYEQGWNYCQGGADPMFYCPAGTSFTVSGFMQLPYMSVSQPETLEFALIADVFTNVVGDQAASASATFDVFSSTPGVSITSSACGCEFPPAQSSPSLSCPNSDPVTTTITCQVTVPGAPQGVQNSPPEWVDFEASTAGQFNDTACLLDSGRCGVTFTPDAGTEGQTTITAVYSGDNLQTWSSATAQVTVTQRSSDLELACYPNPDSAESPATCLVDVLDKGPGTQILPSGTVSFSTNSAGSFASSSCTLSSDTCSVQYTPDTGSEGTHTISATYSGDTDHSGSSATFGLSVVLRTTYVYLNCVPDQVPVGVASDCQLTVYDSSGGTQVTPTGTVSFASEEAGTFSSNSCDLVDGSCAVTYTPSPGSEGTATLSATYGGDAYHSGNVGYGGVTATTRAVSVALSCSPQDVPVNSPSTCDVTVTDTSPGTAVTPSGPVTFASSKAGSFSGSASCTLSGSGASASCSLTYTPAPGSLGASKIKASYSGDTDHSAGSSTFTVTGKVRATTTSLSCSAPFTQNKATTCTVTVSDTTPGTPVTPTGTVAFSTKGTGSFSSSTCKLSGSGGSATCQVKFTPTGTGSYTLVAKYGGDSTHSASSGSEKFKVT